MTQNCCKNYESSSMQLIDAQHLKFNHPELFWAPDIEELKYLEKDMVVSLLVRQRSQTPESNSHGMVEKSNFRKVRISVKIVFIDDITRELTGTILKQGDHDNDVNCDLNQYRRYGTQMKNIIRFELRHIANVHEEWRDTLFEKMVSNHEMKRHI